MATRNREPRDAKRAAQSPVEDAGERTAEQVETDELSEALASDVAGELAAANDRLLRLQAEMQNLRNRTAREIADERRYAAMPVLRDMLPVVDNIDRAIEAAEKAGEAENLLEGFRLVRQQLVTALGQNHCETIPADGLPFDPNFHAAILQQPSPEVPAGHVMYVAQTGYKLHDRVVRPAQVIVSSGPPQ
jgi:molecular chaperone GrpE